ncbi:uncharacterized protein BJ212DRAFT_1579820 [Suillus subaureus]|uniref:G domain-containing protein n=1 Tax=Suillus subaureus TaxID=48587 RepID=A0A9P7E1K5_9AGAM|nr:uncharacterized protein BJ212DRAFT_1579820 [Suillus subaureus]KAG1808963.1 hypothetical protein BJ212DRAFT_1579820 [Suillus subaureus]
MLHINLESEGDDSPNSSPNGQPFPHITRLPSSPNIWYSALAFAGWPIQLSDISIGISVDFSKSGKNVGSAEVRIGRLRYAIEREVGKILRRTFSPPIELALADSFSLDLRHKSWWFGAKAGHEDINFDTNDIIRVERQEYIKFHKKIKITVELFGNTSTSTERAEQTATSSGEHPELQSTTGEIIRICPRFRILVIGKTGVGKSTLINQAFGVEEALTSHDKPGEANIDTEFISKQNDNFVLHDSKGFEPGEEDNVQIVLNFIQRRISEPALKDQLHAVWLCFEIPRAGGRLLETGMEAFLTLKRNGKLGNIPVVAVFTKYDMLIERMERTLDGPSLKRLSDDAIKKLVNKKADAELKNICIQPLQKFAGRHVPCAAISKDHKETLVPLIQVTENLVRQHFAFEASVMTSIAQRVDPGLKMNASIEVGKRRYWNALASSTAFKNHTIRECLHVLHDDIVAVWNFHDPHRYLYSPEFRTLMVNMVDKIDAEPTADPNKTITVGLSIVGAITCIISASAAPAAPIVVPIAASVVLAVWARDVYQTSHAVLQRFMSYIIDLTLVLQTLHLVSESQPLSRRAIKLALASYYASPISGEVHTKIQMYNRQLTLLERVDRDTLDKIIELMQLYSIGAEKLSALRAQISLVDVSSDEPWEVEKAA